MAKHLRSHPRSSGSREQVSKWLVTSHLWEPICSGHLLGSHPPWNFQSSRIRSPSEDQPFKLWICGPLHIHILKPCASVFLKCGPQTSCCTIPWGLISNLEPLVMSRAPEPEPGFGRITRHLCVFSGSQEGQWWELSAHFTEEQSEGWRQVSALRFPFSQ